MEKGRKDSGLNKKISLFISVLILMGFTSCSPVEITPTQPVPTMMESTSTPMPTLTATLTVTPTITLSPTATYTPTPVYEMLEIKHETNVLKDVSFASEIVTNLQPGSEVILLGETAYISPTDPAWMWWNVRTVDGDGYIAEMTDEGRALLSDSCAMTMYDAMKLAVNKYSPYPGFNAEYGKYDNTNGFQYSTISLGLTKTEVISGVPVDAVKLLAVDLSPETGKPTARIYFHAMGADFGEEGYAYFYTYNGDDTTEKGLPMVEQHPSVLPKKFDSWQEEYFDSWISYYRDNPLQNRFMFVVQTNNTPVNEMISVSPFFFNFDRYKTPVVPAEFPSFSWLPVRDDFFVEYERGNGEIINQYWVKYQQPPADWIMMGSNFRAYYEVADFLNYLAYDASEIDKVQTCLELYKVSN
jgi:hypothetical protein